MSDQSIVADNDPAISASIDPAEETGPASSVEIPESWASMHWKHVVMLAKQIAGNIEITFEDAKRIISDELVTREATGADDGLVAMTKNGDTLRVNAATVDAHKRAGWALV